MKKNEVLYSDQAASMLLKMKKPVNAISDFSELLVSGDCNAATCTFYTMLIQQACDQLFKAIDDMLFIYGAGDSEKVEKQFFDLNKMFDKLFFTYHKAVLPKGIELICNQPCAQPDSFVWSDEKILKRIYGHLLDNALKYTTSGYIVFGYKTDKYNHLVLYVSDTGMGINDEDKEKVFEPHYRSPEVLKKGIEGTGLGLGIVTRLAGMLGTKMQLETESGKGSCFWFTLEQDNSNQMLNNAEENAVG